MFMMLQLIVTTEHNVRNDNCASCSRKKAMSLLVRHMHEYAYSMMLFSTRIERRNRSAIVTEKAQLICHAIQEEKRGCRNRLSLSLSIVECTIYNHVMRKIFRGRYVFLTAVFFLLVE